MADRTVGNFQQHNRGGCRLGVGAAFAWIALVLLVFSGLGTLQAAAQALVQNRIVTPIRSAPMQMMHGTVHPKVAIAADQGPLSGSTAIQGMSLVFGRSAAQEVDLKQLLQAQQTPGSPLYHQWLQPGQFAARYGMSAADLAKAAAWLQSQGFKIDAIPASSNRIDFSGTAAQVNAAFQTQLHQYSLRGQMHWANSTEISLPQAIAGMALGVEHLNTFRPRPHAIQRPVHASQQSVSAKPQYTFTDGSGAEVNVIAPSDSQTIYNVTGLYNSGFTGSGETIAIAGQTDIVQYENDIKNFRSLSGLNASNLPTQVLITSPNTGPATVSPSDLVEADIDTEWSGAIAENAAIVYVTVGSNQNYSVFDSLQYAVLNPLAENNTQFAPVISISYGGCEQGYKSISLSEIQQLESVLEQANAQGQTVVASSGDDGSATCDYANTPTPASHGLAVDYPASSQYVTGTGGTSFSGDVGDQSKYWNQGNNSDNGSAISYIPETTWNDTPNLSGLNNTGVLSASGGGASALFTKPSWQAGAGVPSDGKRDVPDVSLAADPYHDGYVLCTEETSGSGSSTRLTGTSSCVYPVGSGEAAYFDQNLMGGIFGGTSIAAPQLAAMITLWNQEAGNTAGVGNANPILYLLAQSTPGAFHDVTTGSNAVVCQQGSPDCISNGAGGYVMSCCNAGAGYDEATGLGSVDATAMGAVWPKVSVTATTPQPTFSLLLNPSAVSVSPGSSITTSVVLNPSGAGANSAGFSGTVALACSNLPAGVSCSFAPSASVNLTSGASQTVTLTVSATTAAATSVASRSTSHPFDRGWPMQTAFAGIFGLSLLGFKRKRRPYPSRWMAVLLLMGGLMAASALTACGGSSSPAGTNPIKSTPTPTTQRLTVTGTSGTTTASAQVQLTVE